MEIKAILKKPYTEQQRINFIVDKNHKLGFEIRETDEALEAWGLDSSEELQNAKKIKIQENDNLRDKALNHGATYKGILFDSDTDQKVNLLAIVSTMSDEDTIIWFGKDNQPLECDKQDLINIGGSIAQLHTFCWNKNAYYKVAINSAQSAEELNDIIIDYSLEDR